MRSQLAVLTAQLQQAQVRQRAAQHDLEQTELRAPFPGVVTERLAQRGEYVTTGAAIAHLVDTVHLEVRAQGPLALVEPRRIRPWTCLSRSADGSSPPASAPSFP